MSAMMRPLLIICASGFLCLCAPFAAQAEDATPPPAPQTAAPDQNPPPLPFVPGNQKKFDQGAAAFDAGDYKEAYRIFSELAGNYDLAAMRNVALMERKGLGTPKDPQAAEDMMGKAARRGLPTAQADLGVMLMDGEAGSPDEKAALPWLEKAARAQHPIAQFRLGELLEEGAVVPKNIQAAELLYGAAARHGVAEAAERLEKLKGWTELPPGFMDGPDPVVLPATTPPSNTAPSP
jgi:TPR repeat protein